MILADKIIRLRKKNGWSQEELADRMHVSRQAVSKWEAAQTTPDLEKVLQLSKLFGVTTDYLLKDDLDTEEFTDDSADRICKLVSMEDANQYIAHRKWASGRIALATVLCILSPICLFLLGGASEMPEVRMSDSFLVFCGLAVLFVMVAIAVAVFIYVGFKHSPYEFLEKENFELAYGVSGMVRERQKTFRNTYIKGNIIATCLCILSPIVLLLGAFTANSLLTVVFLCALLLIVGLAVGIFVAVGVQWASMERLLREGEFAPKEKAESKLSSVIANVYWPLATAIYLVWSFLSGNWHITWILWPVAGILYGALMGVVKLFAEKDEK